LDTTLAIDLARVQFAFTIAFHIIFPAFTIGLASYLAVLEALWLLTKRDIFFTLFRFWLPIFAIAFGMGVVSGLVMSYQFGTNWSVFADKTAPVLGPLLGYEVLTAFFLEAGFLGVMLFGLERVGKGLHFFATLMVAIGTLFSAFWILAANSWMQTPVGHAVNEVGQFVPVDWLQIIFNPSFPFRFIHMVQACYLTTALIVAAVAALHLKRDAKEPGARTMFAMAISMIALVAPLQLFVGDLHGLNTLEHQPAKVAAMEGHFETERGAPLILFGIPDDDAEVTHYAIEIPKAGSLILTHDFEGEVRGLKSFPRDERPPSLLVFFAFRVMVGLGLLMIALGITGAGLAAAGRLFDQRWFLNSAMLMGPAGIVAIIAGWIVTEVGRQPFTVYGLLRTSQSASPVDAPAIAVSLAAFVVVYLIIFGAGVRYMLRLMTGPIAIAKGPVKGEPTRAAGITPGPAVEPGAFLPQKLEGPQ
jgi:cytochrome bd ubiquinol oxidase subunit I